VQLSILTGGGARRHDAELATGEIEPRTTENLPIPFDDHPVVEKRVETANVGAKAIVQPPVHDGAGCLAGPRHATGSPGDVALCAAAGPMRRHSRVAFNVRGSPQRGMIARAVPPPQGRDDGQRLGERRALVAFAASRDRGDNRTSRRVA